MRFFARAAIVALITLTACVRSGFDPAGFPLEEDATLPADGGPLDITGPDTGPIDSGGEELPDASGPDSAVTDEAGADGGGSGSVAIILSLQGQSDGYLARLRFDPDAAGGGSVVRNGQAQAISLAGPAIRGLALDRDARLIIGHGWERQLLVAALENDAALLSLSLEDSLATVEAVPANTHGICVLQMSGELVIGEYGDGAGNAVSLYSVEAGRVVFSAPIYLTQMPGGTLTHCQAIHELSLYACETDAASDGDGDVVLLSRPHSAGPWMEQGRFDTSAFDQDQGSSGTTVYAFVAHSSGDVYIFPEYRFGARFTQLIRCPPTLLASSCVAHGALPPDDAAALNGADAILNAVQIPGHEDMLFTTNRALYRYDTSSGSYIELFDLNAGYPDLLSGDGSPDSIVQVRGMVLR